MNNPYDYWEKALADPKALRSREFTITTDPQSGYYRTYKLLEPVAIWHDEQDGELVVLVNGMPAHPDDHETIWLHSAKNPVEEEDYHAAVDGKGWRDLDDAVSLIGDNRRRGDDPESLIDDLAAQAETYREITDDDTAKRAISLRAALLEQHKRADTIREEAKKPHLKAAREVDELWMHVVKKAKRAADTLRALVEGWETQKRRLAREAAEAEQARWRETNAAAVIVPEPIDQIRTGYGKAASVRTVMKVTGIDDIHKLVDHLKNTQWSTMHSMLMELAQKDVSGGMTVPGVTVEEQAVVR